MSKKEYGQHLADAKQLLAAAKAVQADATALGLDGHNDTGPIVKEVLSLQQRHCETWRDKPDEYWYARLAEEMLELSLALRDQHEHTPDAELTQIAAICLNWLDMRRDREEAHGS